MRTLRSSVDWGSCAWCSSSSCASCPEAASPWRTDRWCLTCPWPPVLRRGGSWSSTSTDRSRRRRWTGCVRASRSPSPQRRNRVLRGRRPAAPLGTLRGIHSRPTSAGDRRPARRVPKSSRRFPTAILDFGIKVRSSPCTLVKITTALPHDRGHDVARSILWPCTMVKVMVIDGQGHGHGQLFSRWWPAVVKILLIITYICPLRVRRDDCNVAACDKSNQSYLPYLYLRCNRVQCYIAFYLSSTNFVYDYRTKNQI